MFEPGVPISYSIDQTMLKPGQPDHGSVDSSYKFLATEF